MNQTIPRISNVKMISVMFYYLFGSKGDNLPELNYLAAILTG